MSDSTLFPARIGSSEKEAALVAISEKLNLPDPMFEKAEGRYEAVRDWLEREGTAIYGERPHVYVHGSFALGTMIRPSNDNDEFDIDLICELNRSPISGTQEALKYDVGVETESYRDSHGISKPVKEWDKCWTLEYTDESYTFRMDIAPAIPDRNGTLRLIREARLEETIANRAILITDMKRGNYTQISGDWKTGNPRGYAQWFRGRMQVRLNEMKEALARLSLSRTKAEDIPDDKVKTPLQRSVQILKRHRDVYFSGKDYAPASVVITTLAAQAYENEADLVSALDRIVNNMLRFIGPREQTFRVQNPVDPSENLTDSWSESPSYAESFFAWIEQLKRDWNAFKSIDASTGELLLESSFGRALTKKAYDSLRTGASQNLPARFDVPQRQPPRWPVHVQYPVTLRGQYEAASGRWVDFNNDSPPLPKEVSLQFHAATDVPKPFDVYWQVVNTGSEAERWNNLRGEIHMAQSVGAGGLHSATVPSMREHTRFTGMHWVECFIVKNGVCVARSYPYVVNIQ